MTGKITYGFGRDYLSNWTIKEALIKENII